MKNRFLEEKDKILALKEEQAMIMQKSDLLRLEQRDLLSSVDDLRRRSKFPPTEYLKIESEHLKRMEDMENATARIVFEKDSATELLNTTKHRYNKLSEEYNKVESSMAARKYELQRIDNELQLIVDTLGTEDVKYNNIILSYKNKIRDLDSEINEKTNELQRTTAECRSMKENIERESNVLSIRRSDLEIYEARLRRKFPNEKIILV